MDRTHDAETLHRRLTELETALRQPGGISILEERELLAVRRALNPSRLTTIAPTASAVHAA